jgi:hypothetical protein
MAFRTLFVAGLKLALLAVAVAGVSADAFAQGLLWRLPGEEGKWIRFEGTYKQTVHRPNNAEGDLNVEWTKHITIKSLKKEEADWRGTSQPCWWIEIKAVTGQVKEGIIDAGPGGSKIYKLLVPEAAIQGKVNEEIAPGREIFVSFIPVVKGFRKVGEEAAEPIASGNFDLYPVVSQLRHLRDLEEGAEETFQTPLGDAAGKLWKGTTTMESRTQRTTLTSEIARTDDPKFLFGVAKWNAKASTEEKSSTAPRSEFQPHVEIDEVMQAIETGEGAESEIADADAAAPANEAAPAANDAAEKTTEAKPDADAGTNN